jgi:protein-S-isoprenylcysteine O-methyltransferase Ste14
VQFAKFVSLRAVSIFFHNSFLLLVPNVPSRRDPLDWERTVQKLRFTICRSVSSLTIGEKLSFIILRSHPDMSGWERVKIATNHKGVTDLNSRTASLTGYFVLVLALVGLVLESSIFAIGYVLITIQLLAIMLMVWARITFGRRSFHAGANPTEGGLVTTGPYAFIRHPIYASILYFLWAAVFSHLSVINVSFGAIGTVGVSIRIYAEEHFLLLQYPEYADYAARTKRVIPFLI